MDVEWINMVALIMFYEVSITNDNKKDNSKIVHCVLITISP